MNVSVSELIVILLIALLVIKPEQMPGIAHKLGQLTRKAQRMMKKFKTDVSELTDDTFTNKKL